MDCLQKLIELAAVDPVFARELAVSPLRQPLPGRKKPSRHLRDVEERMRSDPELRRNMQVAPMQTLRGLRNLPEGSRQYLTSVAGKSRRPLFRPMSGPPARAPRHRSRVPMDPRGSPGASRPTGAAGLILLRRYPAVRHGELQRSAQPLVRPSRRWVRASSPVARAARPSLATASTTVCPQPHVFLAERRCSCGNRPSPCRL